MSKKDDDTLVFVEFEDEAETKLMTAITRSKEYYIYNSKRNGVMYVYQGSGNKPPGNVPHPKLPGITTFEQLCEKFDMWESEDCLEWCDVCQDWMITDYGSEMCRHLVRVEGEYYGVGSRENTTVNNYPDEYREYFEVFVAEMCAIRPEFKTELLAALKTGKWSTWADIGGWGDDISHLYFGVDYAWVNPKTHPLCTDVTKQARQALENTSGDRERRWGFMLGMAWFASLEKPNGKTDEQIAQTIQWLEAPEPEGVLNE